MRSEAEGAGDVPDNGRHFRILAGQDSMLSEAVTFWGDSFGDKRSRVSLPAQSGIVKLSFVCYVMAGLV